MSLNSLVTSDTASAKNLVSIDKDGSITVLDPEVLDLIAGGTAPAAHVALEDNSGCTNGNCLRREEV
jgi:hypothetical protein